MKRVHFQVGVGVFNCQHREHTILLSRERVNRVNKGTNSSPVVISLSYANLMGKPLLTNPA